MGDSRPTVQIFERLAAAYDEPKAGFYRQVATRLVGLLDVPTAGRVLDVGCGTGACLDPLAARVGPTGAVTGIDRSPRMLDEAARHTAHLPNVTVVAADALAIPMSPGTIDVVTASLVLHLLPRADETLRHWIDLLKVDGRIGVSSFLDRTPEGWGWFETVFRNCYGRSPNGSGPLTQPDGLSTAFRRAGLEPLKDETVQLDIVFADADHWWRWLQGTAAGALLAAGPLHCRESIISEARRQWLASDASTGWRWRPSIQICTGVRE